ncbi:MAG: nuclear transport factor 2 family protein [Actinomycetota bacterium]
MTSDHLLHTVLGLERAVWQALVDGDTAADKALLSPDFLGVYPTGFADRTDHAGQLADGPTVAEFSIHDPRVLTIERDLVLLSYDARYRRPGNEGAEQMYVSSLWRNSGGHWRNLFSQDTPAI